MPDEDEKQSKSSRYILVALSLVCGFSLGLCALAVYIVHESSFHQRWENNARYKLEMKEETLERLQRLRELATESAHRRPASSQEDATPSTDLFEVKSIFFGTDRKEIDERPYPYFGTARAPSMTLGRALVSVPKQAHRFGIIERPGSIGVMRITFYTHQEDPRSHFTLRRVEILDKQKFIERFLSEQKSNYRRGLLFLHGYGTDFEFALFRAAQIAYDINYEGMALAYSWPSSGGFLDYIYDRDSSDRSVPRFKEFLDMVRSSLNIEHLTIIAHSMGNRPLLAALRELQLQNAPKDAVKIDQIILAAPDIDSELFELYREALKRYSPVTTLYASENDKAMMASRAAGGGVYRLGDVGPDGPAIEDAIDSIDASSVGTDILSLNHSTYAERTVLLNDIALLVSEGRRPPNKRTPVLKEIQTKRGVYWQFPK